MLYRYIELSSIHNLFITINFLKLSSFSASDIFFTTRLSLNLMSIGDKSELRRERHSVAECDSDDDEEEEEDDDDIA